MSNYIQKAYNPSTGKVEEASYMDDYFGPHKYGVMFADGGVYRDEEVKPYYEDRVDISEQSILAVIKDFRTMAPKFRTDKRLAEMLFKEFKKHE